ncbi:MAG TPA: proton-conducting transporter membrane subunit, partial [Kofleriaceae bacterium]|nr:proton-conducting transporter membrane subunit [Kofleriaceae bacterium]
LCAIYGGFYLDPARRPGGAAAAFNLLLAAMLLVLLARDAVVLLIAWEVMTVASYLLVSYDHHAPAVRRAGWVFLIAGHLGVACLLALFVLLGQLAGSLGFSELAARPLDGSAATIAAVLALLGFGVKAGIVPLHVWLPEAHAAAPSHVSAAMSAVMIKLGLYGILRTLGFLAPAGWWGPVLAGLGAVSALVGIALALYQRDLKRALAYSSIENVGIILLGLGVGLWAAQAQRPEIAALALSGALLHIWNHAAMKSLLFLGAGSLLHGAGTRDLEAMGGLMRRMPRTGALVMLGAVAIAGLPPLAGFSSEWLVYRGLVAGGLAPQLAGNQVLWFIVALIALATVGVLAVLCFVRITGIALLGQPRGDDAAHAHESSAGMVAPMAVLAVVIVAMPFVAPRLVGLLGPAIAQLARAAPSTAPASAVLAPIAWLGLALWLAFAAGMLVLRRLASRAGAPARQDDTWGCGYAAPTPRMQYTSGSFAESMLQLLPRALRARIVVRREASPFPARGELVSDRADPFTRSAYEPLLDRLGKRFAQLHWVQQGITHLYVLYIIATVVIALAVVRIYQGWGP